MALRSPVSLLCVLVLVGPGPRLTWAQKAKETPISPVTAAGGKKSASEKPQGPVQPGAAAGKDTREICPDCHGSRQIPCSVCGGDKKAPGDCPNCNPDGKVICDQAGCRGGKRSCVPCNGTGQVTIRVPAGQKKDGRRMETIYITKRVDCQPCANGMIDCSPCQDGFIKCKRCKGTHQQQVDCRGCDPKGKMVCTRCNGEGKVGLLHPDEPISRTPVAVPVETDTLQSIESLVQYLQGSSQQAKDALDNFFEQKVRFQQANTAFHDLERIELVSERLKAKLEVARRSQDSCERSFKVVAEVIPRLERLRGDGDAKVEKFTLLKRKLPLDPGTEGQQLRLDAENRFAISYQDTVLLLQQKLAGWRDNLDNLEAEIGSVKRVYSQELEAREQEQAMYASFGKVQEAFVQLTRQTELSELRCSLKKGSTVGAICAEIRYFDPEAQGTAAQADILPTEQFLERLPEVIDAAFNANPDIKKIVLIVEGTTLGRTGHRERRQIQSFTVTRTDWDELRGGEFQSDWKKLLSLIEPVPAYPRPGWTLDAGWLIAGLILLLFVGLGMAFVARVYMLR